MKLALIADTFPPVRSSGAVQLRDLSRELVKQGHELTVILPSPGQSNAWEVEDFDGAQILRLKAPPTKDLSYVRRTMNELLMPYFMYRNLRKSPLANVCWGGIIWYSPSIFHGPLIKALKRQSQCKSYLIIRDIFPQWALDLRVLKRGVLSAFFNFIAERQYSVADIIGVQTHGNLSYFKKWHTAKSDRSLEVLQNWLGEIAIVPCPINIRDTKLAGRKVFVYAGNMGVAQDVGAILNLAVRMQSRKDVGFLFVGRGSDASTLKDRAKLLELDNTLFHDEIDPDEICALYRQCHAGIIALDYRHKSHNIPGKFLTYMQSGLPVLANLNPDNDLAAMIRSKGVGEVCETNDIAELEKCCKHLLDKIAKDSQFESRCVSLFRDQFDVANTAKQLSAAFADDF